MGKAVAARDYGDTYQAMVFWKYAIQMLGVSNINEIGYEYGKVKSFDDIVVCYRSEQRFRDTYIDTDYIQVKFHMKQSGEFTMDNLLDPTFINAKKNSFLQNIVNAYRNKEIEFSRSRFTIYSVWRIRSEDVLNKLISNVDKTFDLNELQKGKSQNSEMGALRQKLCEELSVTESELLDILRQVRIKDGQESFEDLKEQLNREFSHQGLLENIAVLSNFSPYLTAPYGEKVKAYLQRGARALPGFTEYPNPQVGYGALCLRDSLPK